MVPESGSNNSKNLSARGKGTMRSVERLIHPFKLCCNVFVSLPSCLLALPSCKQCDISKPLIKWVRLSVLHSGVGIKPSCIYNNSQLIPLLCYEYYECSNILRVLVYTPCSQIADKTIFYSCKVLKHLIVTSIINLDLVQYPEIL